MRTNFRLRKGGLQHSKSVSVTWHPNVLLPMCKWVLVWSWWVRKVSRNEIQFIRVNSIICRNLWKYIVLKLLYFQYQRPIGQWIDLRISCRRLKPNFIMITWSNQVYCIATQRKGDCSHQNGYFVIKRHIIWTISYNKAIPGFKCTDSFSPLTCKKKSNWRCRVCTIQDWSPVKPFAE